MSLAFIHFSHGDFGQSQGNELWRVDVQEALQAQGSGEPSLQASNSVSNAR